jgi:hypothetical protein
VQAAVMSHSWEQLDASGTGMTASVKGFVKQKPGHEK